MSTQIDAVKKLARDLRKEEPRSPDEKLGGFALAARCVDKCRASILGWEGDYKYGCPMDQEFLEAAGIEKEQFKEYIATGASDSQIDRWIRLHAGARA
ncbi:MAG: uncharacterized protein JWR26_3280 [Pedosphaera sp.]|nr:uncharacterized protein [Pedosphaera sp.]